MTKQGQWFIVCDLEGGHVADVKLTDPPVVRGPVKALRAALKSIGEVLNTKNFLLHDEAGGTKTENETIDKPATMKTTMLLSEGDETQNGGGEDTAKNPTPTGDQGAGAQSSEQAAEQAKPAGDNADANGNAA